MFDLKLEREVIASLFSEEEARNQIDQVGINDFSSEMNKTIYEAIKDYPKESSMDLTVLTSRQPKIDFSYLCDAVASTYDSNNWQVKFDRLKEITKKREISLLGAEISRRSQEENILEELKKKIYDIDTRYSKMENSPSEEIVKDVIAEIQRAYNSNDLLGLDIGISKLNKLFDGLQNGLHIVAGRPAMGKTAFSTGIGSHVCKKGKKVAIFSLEMTKEQLIKRMIYQEGCIDTSKVANKQLDESDWKMIKGTGNQISSWNLDIFDSTKDISDIKAKALNLKRLKGLDLIIIDYLQLITTKNNHGNRTLEVKDICCGLIDLWKETKCPIIALSQLSRSVEMRADKRPMLSDLRESGDIEQAADSIWFLYRDEYYNPDSEEKGIAEVIVAKNRYGPVSRAKVGFISNFAKFVNLEEHRR